MKNKHKKWLLFVITTFVTFLGISYTLLKGTKASEVPSSAENVILSDNR